MQALPRSSSVACSLVSRLVLRFLVLVALGSALAPVAAAATTQQGQSKEQCIHSYEEAQRLRNADDLLGAREGFRLCRSENCPSLMHGDCEKWFEEADASLASAVFLMRSSSGMHLLDPKVSIDGGPPSAFDGRAFELNPGEHTVKYQAVGHRELVTRFLLSEGEKLKPIAATLELAEALSTPAHLAENRRAEQGSWTPFLIASSVAVVSAGAFAVFGLQARSADEDLDGCVPDCTEARVDSIRRDYLLANVAAASLAASSVLALVFLVGPLSNSPPPTSKGAVHALRPVFAADSVGIAGQF